MLLNTYRLYLLAFFVVMTGLPVHAEPARMLLMDLKATLVEEETVGLITAVISSELSEYPDFELLTGADMRQLVELEAEKQSMGCANDNSCLAEIAGAIGARYVVFGEMGMLGKSYLLALNLFDSVETKALGRVTKRAKDVEVLADAIPAMIKKLVKKTQAQREQPIAVDQGNKAGVKQARVDAAAQETVPEVTVAPVKPMAVIASSAGLMAVGLGVAAYGGWGFSSFESVMNSATSTKSERESIMIAYQGAPVLMGSGLLVLAGGATLLFWPAEESETE